jgi:hypothetical protein
MVPGRFSYKGIPECRGNGFFRGLIKGESGAAAKRVFGKTFLLFQLPKSEDV